MSLPSSRKRRRLQVVDTYSPHPAESPSPTEPYPPAKPYWQKLQGACIPTKQAGPLDPNRKHRNLRSSRAEGVGDWLLRTDEFINWNTGEDGVASPVLFWYGEAGVGKTHIRSELTFLWGNGRLNGSILVQLPGYRHTAQSETRGSGYHLPILRLPDPQRAVDGPYVRRNPQTSGTYSLGN